jgi:hypothetical protein
MAGLQFSIRSFALSKSMAQSSSNLFATIAY